MKAGGELDALVAEKVMGWQLSDRGFYVKDIGQPESYDTPDTFKPSIDIAAAWQVVERMREEHDLLLVVKPYSLIAANGGYRVGVQRVYKEVDYATADTAPLAICRAALSVLRVEVSG